MSTMRHHRDEERWLRLDQVYHVSCGNMLGDEGYEMGTCGKLPTV